MRIYTLGLCFLLILYVSPVSANAKPFSVNEPTIEQSVSFNQYALILAFMNNDDTKLISETTNLNYSAKKFISNYNELYIKGDIGISFIKLHDNSVNDKSLIATSIGIGKNFNFISNNNNFLMKQD